MSSNKLGDDSEDNDDVKKQDVPLTLARRQKTEIHGFNRHADFYVQAQNQVKEERLKKQEDDADERQRLRKKAIDDHLRDLREDWERLMKSKDPISFVKNVVKLAVGVSERSTADEGGPKDEYDDYYPFYIEIKGTWNFIGTKIAVLQRKTFQPFHARPFPRHSKPPYGASRPVAASQPPINAAIKYFSRKVCQRLQIFIYSFISKNQLQVFDCFSCPYPFMVPHGVLGATVSLRPRGAAVDAFSEEADPADAKKAAPDAKKAASSKGKPDKDADKPADFLVRRARAPPPPPPRRPL